MKAIITDLDRTLLRTDKTISEHTLSVLKACREKGIPVMAATARPERSISIYRNQVGFQAAATLNGAKILLPSGVIENGISFASAEIILRKIVGIPGIKISLETEKGIFSNMENPEWNPVVYKGFPGLPECKQIYKLLLNSPENDLRQAVKQSITEDVYFTIADEVLVQIMDKKATKWNGIKAMLGAMGLSPEDAVYFGDDNDDIEPVSNCGVGIAVSNAIDEVLAAADYVTAANDLDGVAQWIEKHLL